MHLLQSLLGHLSVIQNFIFSLNIPSEYLFFMTEEETIGSLKLVQEFNEY